MYRLNLFDKNHFLNLFWAYW